MTDDVTTGEQHLIRDLVDALDASAPSADPRDDIDTASLRRRFPRLAEVVTSGSIVESRHGLLPARLYRPGDGRATAACVWVHGGAYIFGGLDSPEANWFSLELAARGIAVLSIDYHLARNGVSFPVPLDDVSAGWRHGLDVFARLGFAADRVHLGGGSAGANLALCAALRERDLGRGLPASLALLYPLAHAELPTASAELRRATANMGRHYTFTGLDVAAISRNYLGANPGIPRYAFAGGEDLRGLPRTLVVNAEKDSLRASGEAVGEALGASGVDVSCECQRGIGHGHVDDPGSAGTAETVDRFVSWFGEIDERVAGSHP